MRWCEGPVTWWKLLMVFVLGFFHCLPWVTDELHHCGDFLLSQFHGFTCLQENSGLCYCRRGCLAERLPWWEVISLPSMLFLSPPLREYVSDRGCPLLTLSHVVGVRWMFSLLKMFSLHRGCPAGFRLGMLRTNYAKRLKSTSLQWLVCLLSQ